MVLVKPSLISANFLLSDEFVSPNMYNCFVNTKHRCICLKKTWWGHGGRVVILSPPTSEAGVRFPARPEVGKLVVACRWSAVYSTEP